MSTQEMSYAVLAWYLLIANGGAVKSPTKDFYSSTVNADYELTKKAYQDILEHGLDFDNMDAPKDDYKMTFVGTFEPPQKDVIIYGVLKTNNGSTYNFESLIQHNNEGVTRFIRLIADNVFTYENAINKLGERLNKYAEESDIDIFQYTCIT